MSLKTVVQPCSTYKVTIIINIVCLGGSDVYLFISTLLTPSLESTSL